MCRYNLKKINSILVWNDYIFYANIGPIGSTTRYKDYEVNELRKDIVHTKQGAQIEATEVS